MLLRTAASCAALLALTAACGDDATAPTRTTAADPTTTAAVGAGLEDRFGVRYCEVLALTAGAEGSTAEVWGTQGINDCPQERFDAIDPDALAADLDVAAAVLNGPRHWVLDEIVVEGLAGSGEVRDLDGIEMRSIAVVDLGPGIPDRTPLTETSVERDTQFVFSTGREVHELTGPDGSVYVMQSYSLEVDPQLTVEGLVDLESRLDLPTGWAFTSRVLDEPLVVEDLDGVATVIQDRLRNSYQLRARG